MSCYRETSKNLSLFPCTYYTGKTCCDSLDRPISIYDEFECCNYKGEDTCAHCILIFAPCALISDLITLPLRSIIRCFGCICKKKIIPVYIEATAIQFDQPIPQTP